MAKRRFSFKFVTKEGSAFMVGTHIVGGIIAGSFLGFAFDHFFKTQPWGLIVGFFLGVVAGFKNAYQEMQRAVKKVEEDESQKRENR
jgi:ATP synthase protein I